VGKEFLKLGNEMQSYKLSGCGVLEMTGADPSLRSFQIHLRQSGQEHMLPAQSRKGPSNIESLINVWFMLSMAMDRQLFSSEKNLVYTFPVGSRL